MSSLRVGMAVRIRWSITWPELNGQTGHIVAAIPDHLKSYLPAGHTGEWEVAVDMWGGSASPDGEGFFFPASEQLEPVLPDGRQVVEWEDCAWSPERAETESSSSD